MYKATAIMIGNRVKEAIKLRKTTQKKLAEIVFVTPVTMNRYCKGEREIPIDVLKNISVHLQVDIRYLLGEVDDPISQIVRDSKDILANFAPVPQDNLDQLLKMYEYQHIQAIGDGELYHIISKNNVSYTVTGSAYCTLAKAIGLTVENTLDNFLRFQKEETTRIMKEVSKNGKHNPTP